MSTIYYYMVDVNEPSDDIRIDTVFITYITQQL